MGAAFQRGETDLLVFISSVMNVELKRGREVAEQTVIEFPITRPWAFEDTPASSRAPADEYLRAASEADIVIWLIGQETSLPVTDEINACVSAGRRLLAFRLPSESRDEPTQRLIRSVSEYAKWKDVSDISDLAEHIKAALSDELVRALRNPTPPTRRTKLCEAHRLSVARCKHTWIALGVPGDIATGLAEDHTVGDVVELPNSGLHVVTGDQGSGKSLAVERLFQRLVQDALTDSARPFPLFVNARDLNEPLSDYVDRMSQGYTQPSVQGASILIDGLDEIGVTAANDLLRQSSAYTDANSDATAIVTSRLLPGLKQAGEQIAMPSLGDGHIICLINRISGLALDMRVAYEWSDSTWDAARRPLFAVMIGSELRRAPSAVVPRPSQLVDRLARGALQEVGGNTEVVDALLQTLAVKAINSGTRVSLSEVSPQIPRQRLIADSRLVSEQETAVDFTLPIFREWYAARALIEQTVSIDDILSTSDRWIIPLQIVLDSGSEDLGRLLMTRLASSDPGLASLLLRDTEPLWPDHETDQPSLGTPIEVGEEIQNAMEAWRRGLGNLYSVIGPVDRDGNTATLGIRLKDHYVTTSWYAGAKKPPTVVELPESLGWSEPRPDWTNWSSTQISPAKTWPWILTKDHLVDSISRMTGSRHLALESIDAVRELSWVLARNIKKQGGFNPHSIIVHDIIRRIDELGIDKCESFTLGTTEGDFSDKEILLVKQYLLDLVGAGEDRISDPWPSADQLAPSGWVWNSYSPQQLLARTSAVYAGALHIYKDMIDRWFGAFSTSLQLSRLLPVRLEGILALPNQEVDQPVLTWCTRCLPYSSESTVDFTLGDEWEFRDVRTYWRDEGSRLRQLRPTNGTAPSPIYSTQLLPVWESRPATELAHNWLGDELRELGWHRF